MSKSTKPVLRIQVGCAVGREDSPIANGINRAVLVYVQFANKAQNSYHERPLDVANVWGTSIRAALLRVISPRFCVVRDSSHQTVVKQQRMEKTNP